MSSHKSPQCTGSKRTARPPIKLTEEDYDQLYLYVPHMSRTEREEYVHPVQALYMADDFLYEVAMSLGADYFIMHTEDHFTLYGRLMVNTGAMLEEDEEASKHAPSRKGTVPVREDRATDCIRAEISMSGFRGRRWVVEFFDRLGERRAATGYEMKMDIEPHDLHCDSDSVDEFLYFPTELDTIKRQRLD